MRAWSGVGGEGVGFGSGKGSRVGLEGTELEASGFEAGARAEVEVSGDDELFGVKGSEDGGVPDFEGLSGTEFGVVGNDESGGFGSGEERGFALGLKGAVAEDPGGDPTGNQEGAGFEFGGGDVG